MFILIQDKKTVFNSNHFISIETEYESVIATEEDYGNRSWNMPKNLGRYKDKERAKEVLNQLFDAIKAGCSGFEMPEE